VLGRTTYQSATEPYRNGDLALAVLTADGSGDPGFDGNGQTLLDLEIDAAGVAVARDGAISLTGGYQDTSNFNLARITAAGEPDSTFAGDGVAFIDGGGGEDISDAAVVDDQGRTLIAGSTEGARSTTDYALVRVTETGTPDRTFSEDGKLTTEFDIGKKNEYDDADAITLDRESRILVAGTVGEHKLGVSRHLVARGPRDFDADGVADRNDRCPERYGTRSNGCPSRGQQTR